MPWLVVGLLMIFVAANQENEGGLHSLALFTALVPLYCWLLNEKEWRRPHFFGLGVAVAGAFLVAFSKVTIGFFCAVALALILIRHRRKVSAYPLAVALVALAFVTARYLAPTNEIQWTLGPLGLLTSYGQFFTWQGMAHLCLPAALIWLVLVGPRFENYGRGIEILWRQRPSWREFLESGEGGIALLIATLAASTAVLFTVPVSSNMLWFSMTPFWLAVILLPFWAKESGLNVFEPLLRPWMGKAAVAVLMIVFTAQFQGSFGAVTGRLVAGLEAAGTPSPRLRQSIRETGSLWGLYKVAIEKTPWHRRMEEIASMNAAQALAVHIPPDASEVWEHLKPGTGYWCMAAHLAIPAEIGVVQIRSIEPAALETSCIPYVIYGYGVSQDEHRSVPLSDGALCSEARALNLARAYIFRSITVPNENRLVSCG